MSNLNKFIFSKIRKYLRKAGISNDVFAKEVGITIELWEGGSVSEYQISRKTDDQYLKQTISLFEKYNLTISERSLLAQPETFDDILSVLIDLSWEKNKFIDQEHIIPDEIRNLKLTQAEMILLYEGTQTGEADCTISSNAKYEYTGSGDINADVIRSEIFEWLLSPEVCKLFVRSGSLRITGAEFKRSRGVNNNTFLKADSIKLNDTIIDIDLFFNNCRFAQSVVFENSQTHSLHFLTCIIGSDPMINDYGYASFVGNNMVMNGDLVFTSKIHSDQYLGNKKKSIPYEENDVYGSIEISNSEINGYVDISACIIKHAFIADNIKCARISGVNSIIKGEQDNKTTVQEGLSVYLNTCEVAGIISFEDAFIWGQFEAIGIKANSIFLRHGFMAFKGVAIFKSSFVMDVDCSDAFFGVNNFEQAVTASRIHVTNMHMSGMVSIGTVYLRNSIIETVLDLKNVVISDDKTGRALDAENVTVGRIVTFYDKDSKEKTNNYNGISKRISDVKEILAEAAVQVNEFNKKGIESKLENIGNIQTALNKFESINFKQTISNTIGNDKFDKYGLIIGNASFEGAQISGKLDMAGCLFYNPIPDNIDKIGKFDSFCNQRLYLKILWNFLLIIPGLVLFVFRTLWLISTGLLYWWRMISDSKNKDSHKQSFNDSVSKRRECTIAKFVHPEPVNCANAVTLSHANIGNLFLNQGRGADAMSFISIGEVDLQCSRLNNFFISPDLGSVRYTRWNVIGLKYDYIYSSDLKDEHLSNWFFDYVHQENYRQPYEQLAATYMNMGDETSARKVLMSTPGKRVGEKILMSLLAVLSWMALPPYRALFTIMLLWFAGTFWMRNAYAHEDIVRVDSTSNHIQFSASSYALQHLIPFITSDQKELFAPSNQHEDCDIYVPFRPSIVPNCIPRKIETKHSLFGMLHGLYSFLGIILISLFLLGIARIIRNT